MVSTGHVATGNQGVRCSQPLKASGLPLNSMECEEFFIDYLLRKVMAKPPEYTQWPPALRLFYRFLSEKDYLDDPEPMMASLHAIEPDFIALVQQRS